MVDAVRAAHVLNDGRSQPLGPDCNRRRDFDVSSQLHLCGGGRTDRAEGVRIGHQHRRVHPYCARESQADSGVIKYVPAGEVIGSSQGERSGADLMNPAGANNGIGQDRGIRMVDGKHPVVGQRPGRGHRRCPAVVATSRANSQLQGAAADHRAAGVIFILRQHNVARAHLRQSARARDRAGDEVGRTATTDTGIGDQVDCAGEVHDPRAIRLQHAVAIPNAPQRERFDDRASEIATRRHTGSVVGGDDQASAIAKCVDIAQLHLPVFHKGRVGVTRIVAGYNQLVGALFGERAAAGDQAGDEEVARAALIHRRPIGVNGYGPVESGPVGIWPGVLQRAPVESERGARSQRRGGTI